MTIAIGITGSLGSGKTTVASMFEELGARSFNADKIAHDLIKKGSPCYQPLVKLLGPGILTDGEIDRNKVAAIVFKEKILLQRIEHIIHPEVIKFVRGVINDSKSHEQDKNEILIFDVPLLFESKLDELMDMVVVVKSTQENQILRAHKHLGISRSQALLRIRAQLPMREKIHRADKVINNNKNLTSTRKQVKQIWQEILLTTEKK